MATYFCRFADLLTDQDLCEMQIPFKMDRRIIVPGAFSSDFDIPNVAVGNAVRMIVPQKTICHIYRDSTILGSYIIWSKKLTGSGGKVKVSLQGATLESYLYRRRLQEDVTYTGQDQISIAADLIARAQVGVGLYTTSGDLSISSVTFSSGITRDRTYLQSDGNFIGDLLEDLANVDAGFEYVIHTYQDETTRPRVATFGYDKFEGSLNPIIIDEPGALTSWNILYDGTKGSTVFWTRGQTSASAGGEATEPTLSSPAFSSTHLDNGWPILEHVADYQNTSSLDTLNKYAAWWALNRGGPIMIPALAVRPESMFRQGFSPAYLGCMAQTTLYNTAFPLVNGIPTYSEQSRIIGFELAVDAKAVDAMNLIVEQEFDPTEVS